MSLAPGVHLLEPRGAARGVVAAPADPGQPLLPPPRLREDPDLERELASRLPPGPWTRSISVTDLLEPRRAFWRHFKGPAPVSEDRRARLEAGRDLHRAVGQALPREGTFEVRIRRHGVSARVDLLADVPVEIKTSVDPLPDDLVTGRPEYVEQMALYGALLDRTSARLVHLHPRTEDGFEIRALDVAFRDVSALREELARRAESLREALRLGAPTGLPRCRWFHAGCEFRAASLCDCSGEEPSPKAGIEEHVVAVVAREDVERRWTSGLAGLAAKGPPPTARRFRDLVYPRRAYFEITEPGPVSEAPRISAADRPPSEVYDGAVGALEGGPTGEVCCLREELPGPAEEVPAWKGEPYLLRTSRAWARVPLGQLLERFPQYALELGFRCAVTGKGRGRLILAYERAERPAELLQVVEVVFGPDLPRYAQLYRERSDALARAVRTRTPGGLVRCADWMTTDCPYRIRCGCPEESGRSQR